MGVRPQHTHSYGKYNIVLCTRILPVASIYLYIYIVGRPFEATRRQPYDIFPKIVEGTTQPFLSYAQNRSYIHGKYQIKEAFPPPPPPPARSRPSLFRFFLLQFVVGTGETSWTTYVRTTFSNKKKES